MQKHLQIAGQMLVLRDMKPSDMGDVLRLHHQVFGSNVHSDWFHWKYVQGRGEGVGIWNDRQELIAFCGGFPRRVLQQGHPAHFLQIGDLMVSPEWRGVFTRKGPFFHACEHLYTTRLGNDRPFQVGFGFAHARSTRLHVKQGLGRDAGSIPFLQWQVAQRKPLPGAPWLWRVEPLAAHAPALRATIDRAWRAMRRETQDYTIGLRDAEYALWRFTQRPDKPYRLFTLRRRWDWHPLGVIVLSQPSHPGEEVQWLDWIGPVRHLANACLAALQIAAQEGAATMTTWASACVTELLATTEPGFLPHIANISLRTPREWSAQQAPDLKLWLMSGDSDFL